MVLVFFKKIIMRSNSWFTFVELIIVISILSLLFSIWFVWFTWYLSWSRDSNRLSQIVSLNNWIRLYWTKNQLPLPEDSVSISLSWWTVAYQWYIWEKILSLIEFQEWWLDPKDKNFFSYYMTKNRKYFQILMFMEESWSLKNEWNNSLFKKTYAKTIDYSKRIKMVYWDKLWILTEENTNRPIQELNDLVISWLDIWTTTDYFTSTIANDDSITWTSWILRRLYDVAYFWWKWCTAKTWIISCTWEVWWWTLVWWWGGWSWPWPVIEDFELETYNWWRRWKDWNLSPNCYNYKYPSPWYKYAWATWDGIYWIEPTVWSSISVYCDMTTDNWWWTLVSNRRKNINNIESCWSNLSDFFNNECWIVTSIGEMDSYSLWRPNRLNIPQTEYLFIQYLNWVPDNDDAYIMRYAWDLFPNSLVNDISIDRVCDINNSNCDLNDVYWKYMWDSFYAWWDCENSYVPESSFYGWNYWLCHNGITTSYPSSNFIWNRDQYNETKSWWEGMFWDSDDYQERVFIR